MRDRFLGHSKRGRVFVLSAPAGTGKTTLVSILTKEFASVKQSVSMTTRLPRADEIDGKHYHFVTRDEFRKRIDSGDFLEHVQLFDHHYGTSKEAMEAELSQGNHLIMVIDTQGALQMMGKYPATFIFISPPSREEQRRRLEGRETESSKSLEQRIAWAEKELQAIQYYDYHVVNHDLDEAYEVLRSIIIAEVHSGEPEWRTTGEAPDNQLFLS